MNESSKKFNYDLQCAMQRQGRCRCSLLAVIAEEEPVETLKLVLSQSVLVLVDRSFFHALPLFHARSALALHMSQ